MRIDLQDPDRSSRLERSKKRIGHGAVATDEDGNSTGGQDLSRLRFYALSIAFIVTHHSFDVANIDAIYRTAVEEWATEIEIPMLDRRSIFLACDLI